MDALKAAGLCALLAASPHAVQSCAAVVQITSPAIDRWETLIEAASKRFGIPADWIRVVMARESAGLTTLNGAPIVSRAGAMGLMQLMPATWSQLRVRYNLGSDPFDAHDNIFGGAAYLREMFERYGFPNLFAAYHAGPGRLDAALAGVKPLPEATKAYLGSIVFGAQIAPVATGNRLSRPANSNSNALFFMRAENDNSSLEIENSKFGASVLFVPLASAPVSHGH